MTSHLQTREATHPHHYPPRRTCAWCMHWLPLQHEGLARNPLNPDDERLTHPQIASHTICDNGRSSGSSITCRLLQVRFPIPIRPQQIRIPGRSLDIWTVLWNDQQLRCQGGVCHFGLDIAGKQTRVYLGTLHDGANSGRREKRKGGGAEGWLQKHACWGKLASHSLVRVPTHASHFPCK